MELPRRWMSLTRTSEQQQKSTKEASTSMEDLTLNSIILKSNMPGSVVRPKSMCVSDMKYFNQNNSNDCHVHDIPPPLPPPNELRNRHHHQPNNNTTNNLQYLHCVSEEDNCKVDSSKPSTTKLVRNLVVDDCLEINTNNNNTRRLKVRRNPVQRAASRLYRAGINNNEDDCYFVRDCIGPEFVVRASLPNKQFVMADCKGNARKTITVIMLNGQKLDIVCNPSATTAGQLFEVSGHFVNLWKISRHFINFS